MDRIFKHIDMTPYADLLQITPMDEAVMGIVRKAAVKMAKDFEAFLADGVIEELKKEGYTDLYLIDRQFVIDALNEKIARDCAPKEG